MGVLPKNELLLLFESGDLITQATLTQLIEAAYNPVLVGGTNVQLQTVTNSAGKFFIYELRWIGEKILTLCCVFEIFLAS